MNPFENNWLWFFIREDGKVIAGHTESAEKGQKIVDDIAKDLGYRLLDNRFSIFI